MDKELIVVKGKVIEQQKSYSPEIGKDIGYEAGAKMIKRHFDEHPDDVVAHFIGKTHIEKILQQPGCIGIRVFHALNELGLKKIVLVGVDNRGNNILTINSINENGCYEQKPASVITNFKDCPPYCGDTEPTKDDSPSNGWW